MHYPLKCCRTHVRFHALTKPRLLEVNKSATVPVSSLDILTVPSAAKSVVAGGDLPALERGTTSWAAVKVAGTYGFINDGIRALPLLFDSRMNIVSDTTKPLWLPGRGIVKAPTPPDTPQSTPTHAWFALESDRGIKVEYVDFSTPVSLTFQANQMTTVQYNDGIWGATGVIAVPTNISLTPKNIGQGWPNDPNKPGAHLDILGQNVV